MFYYTAMESIRQAETGQQVQKTNGPDIWISKNERRGGKLDFDRARVPGPEEADALVERALFLAATGYWYTEVKREATEKGGEKVTRTRKQAAPNLTAIALWLTHRMPERWGDAAQVPPENNLLTLLREELEGGEPNGISALQPQAAPDHDLVEQN